MSSNQPAPAPAHQPALRAQPMSVEYIDARRPVLKKNTRIFMCGALLWGALVTALTGMILFRTGPFHDVTPETALFSFPLFVLALLLGLVAVLITLGREDELSEVSLKIDEEMREYARAFPAVAQYLELVRSMGRPLVQADITQIMQLDPILIRLAKAEEEAQRARK